MNNVRFAGSEEIYQAKVEVLGENLVQLHIEVDVDVSAGFVVLTKGEKVFGDYTGFTTIYREMEDGSVILSNDGSVHVPPVYKVIFVVNNGTIIGETEQTPGTFDKLVIPTVEMNENYEFLGWNQEIPTEGELEKNYTFYAMTRYIPTLEEVKAKKKAEISTVCENTIFAGVDVKIGENYEHFSLKIKDQINLFGKQYQLASGVTSVEYHQDGCPCKYYSAEDMMKIITAAMEWVSYHTTYCNALNMWIAGAETKKEVESIFYGAEVPEEYQSEVLKDYLAVIAAEAEAALNEAETVS